MYCENNLGTEEDVFETYLKNTNLVQFYDDKILKTTIRKKTNLYVSIFKSIDTFFLVTFIISCLIKSYSNYILYCLSLFQMLQGCFLNAF